ncbi:MAG TPA: LysM peptidoglycan-binding domain-containing protein [Streptosporangiaceae bacterium]|nr:LysM peptidoglycan-binding domain-containing protein [Streptosporangiaceae bacterium]
MGSAHRHGRKVKIRRSGRHTAPSPVERAAEKAGKAAPAMAVAGVIVAAPQAPAFASAPHKAPVTHETVAGPAAHARLDAAIRPAQQAGRSYTVASGDTLSSIAQHFYGKAADWQWLYHVNRSVVRNPDLIYPGESLEVPSDPPANFTATSDSGYQPRHAKASSGSDGGSEVTVAAASASSAGGTAAAVGLSGTLGCTGLEQLWEAAGGSASEAVMAASIAMAESGGNQYATGALGERGYWQINPVNGPELSTYDPLGNAKAAVSMSSDGTNWNAWTTYTTGAYQGKC